MLTPGLCGLGFKTKPVSTAVHGVISPLKLQPHGNTKKGMKMTSWRLVMALETSTAKSEQIRFVLESTRLVLPTT